MTEYVLESGTDLGGRQLAYLQQMLDARTRDFIGAVAAQPGQRCLDVGAGGGSIARWLAERTAPTGDVVAVDFDDKNLDVPDDVLVYRHDVNDGLPTEGLFDVVHTRLLLMHLKRRREVFAELVDAVAPGGWLFVVDHVFSGRLRVLSAPTPADAQLFRRVIETTTGQICEPAGIDFGWAEEIDGAMTAAGLHDVESVEHATTVAGGSTGMLLFGNYIRQLDGPLRSLGISDEELARFTNSYTTRACGRGISDSCSPEGVSRNLHEAVSSADNLPLSWRCLRAVLCRSNSAQCENACCPTRAGYA